MFEGLSFAQLRDAEHCGALLFNLLIMGQAGLEPATNGL